MVGLLSNYTSPFDAYANFKQQVPTIGLNTPITGVSLSTIQYPTATPLSYRGNQQYNTYGLDTGFTGYQPKGYIASTPKAVSPYAGTELEGLSASEITDKMRERGRDKSLTLWNIFTDGLYNNFKENPTGFVGGIVGLGGGLWNAYNDYKNQKKYMETMQDAYNLQKQLALNAEQRNQEQWDMTKRQRASSSL